MHKVIFSLVLFSAAATSLFAQLEPYRGKADTPQESVQGATRDGDQQRVDSSRNPVSYASTSRLIAHDSILSFLQLADSIEVSKNGLEGFRVQLFSNSGPKAKTEAFKRQGEFIQLYPDIPSYTKWSSPNWVLRAGDFRTRLEARQFLDEIKSAYPAAFIVTDRVKSVFGD
ncbi:MAG: hypothetical protein Salg2KO_01450 [Salibacteraceae bacterium]